MEEKINEKVNEFWKDFSNVGWHPENKKRIGSWLSQSLQSIAQEAVNEERERLRKLVRDCNPDGGQPELMSCYNEWSGELLAFLSDTQEGDKPCACHCHNNEKGWTHAGDYFGNDICSIQYCIHCKQEGGTK